jgi:predicted MFS family arabinose efflux permease
VAVTRPVLRQVHNIGRRRAWVIWLVGLSVYVLAVFHRTSLGVAGLLAAERFHINAAQLATFTVVQLLRLRRDADPVGVLLDRFGSKRLMFTGLTLMTVGQFWFAFAGSFPVGIAARILLGRRRRDDLHLAAAPRRGLVPGQAGAVRDPADRHGRPGRCHRGRGPAGRRARDLGLDQVVRHGGRRWASCSGAAAPAREGLALPGRGRGADQGAGPGRTLGEVWGNPGTQLGLWVHFTAQFGATVFTMLWGYPFLVSGEGLSPQAASWLLVVMTLTAMAAGPLVAAFTARVPYRRSQLVLGIVLAIVTVWAVTLLWPGRPRSGCSCCSSS